MNHTMSQRHISKSFIIGFFFFTLFLFNTQLNFATVVPKHYTAKTLSSNIKIDGLPDDVAWKTAFVADSFIQLDPVEGAPVSQSSEVRLLYDNTAIYILAIMHDTHADSILQELGNRDEGGNLNSDAFRIGIDPYNKRMNGYVFEVSTSGVQSEWLDNDVTFDAVWESSATINKDGWTAEIKIPYSAIRFPTSAEQQWGIQFARLIRRNREYDQWTLTPKDVNNRMLYWGTLEGIKNIDPPLRLSLTPYLSFYTERSPKADGSDGYEYSYSYSGGADLKYGIDERFTLDMTLLPDFSQVQSDNKVKNLSAFETTYSENRPFFKEGTSLFSKGNLFYSRRIGRTPSLFYDVPGMLADGEILADNPDKARLVNAVKVSGRTDAGLGIGLLNAVTSNTYAVAKDANGNKRKILTEPLSNYNLFIFDQQLKNNSEVFLINTNVSRDGQARDANVTAAQGRFENEKHQYQISGTYSTSHVYEWQTNSENSSQKIDRHGQEYSLGADKIYGNSRYGFYYGIRDSKYDKNDFGINYTNDYSAINLYYTYNMFNPFWKYFNQGYITLYVNRDGKLSRENEMTSSNMGINFYLLFKNNWSVNADAGINPWNGKDYYEPRIEGLYYSTPRNSYGSINFTTDYNKMLAFDFGGRFNSYPSIGNTSIGYYIIPKVRFNDHFSISLSTFVDHYNFDRGFAFASANNDSSYFGRRNILTIENTLTSRYIFKNDMSLSLIARHYWSNGEYDTFFLLNNDGSLIPVSVDDTRICNFNSNYLTVDIVYNWQFAPGSSFLITYKNIISTDTQDPKTDYFKNLSNTFSDRQNNSVSLKFLYYLDYQYLTKKSRQT